MLRAEQSRWNTIGIYFGLGTTLAVLAFLVLLTLTGKVVWPSSPMLLLGVAPILQGLWGRAARVELEATGLRVYSNRHPLGRWVAWNQVADLRVDPPGGPRHLRLKLFHGAEVELPPLVGDGHQLFGAAFQRSK